MVPDFNPRKKNSPPQLSADTHLNSMGKAFSLAKDTQWLSRGLVPHGVRQVWGSVPRRSTFHLRALWFSQLPVATAIRRDDMGSCSLVAQVRLMQADLVRHQSLCWPVWPGFHLVPIVPISESPHVYVPVSKLRETSFTTYLWYIPSSTPK